MFDLDDNYFVFCRKNGTGIVLPLEFGTPKTGKAYEESNADGEINKLTALGLGVGHLSLPSEGQSWSVQQCIEWHNNQPKAEEAPE